MLKNIYISLLALLFFTGAFADEANVSRRDPARRWADSVILTLEPEQRIGQLFLLKFNAQATEDIIRQTEQKIRVFNPSGIVFINVTPKKVSELTKRFNKASKTPLLFAIDANEKYLFDDTTVSLLSNLSLAATRADTLIFYYGRLVGHRVRAMGCHLLFNLPANLTSKQLSNKTNQHFFGQHPGQVQANVSAFFRGLKSEHINAIGGMFPVFESEALPIIKYEDLRVGTINPFKSLFNDTLAGVILSNVFLDDFDRRHKVPFVLSEDQIQKVLKNDLDFNGLLIAPSNQKSEDQNRETDADQNLRAFIAGNDLIFNPFDLEKNIVTFYKAVQKRKIKRVDIDRRIRRSLMIKYRLYKSVETIKGNDSILVDISSQYAQYLNRQVIRQSLTLIKNAGQPIPIRQLIGKHTGIINLNTSLSTSDALKYVNRYARVDFAVGINQLAGRDDIFKPDTNNILFVLIDQNFLGNSGLSQMVWNNLELRLRKAATQTQVLVVYSGAIGTLEKLSHFPNLIYAGEFSTIGADLAIQALFGAIGFGGRIPCSISKAIDFETGIFTQGKYRLAYDIPESAGMRSGKLSKIDTLIKRAIADSVMPGCQVLVARAGTVIYNKSFGTQNYQTNQPVTDSVIYDVASLTKVAATLQAVMFLADRGLLDIEKPIGTYLPELKNTNKYNLTVKQVLSHQAGLQPFIPFWAKTMTMEKSKNYYSEERDKGFTTMVAPNLFTHSSIEDTVWSWLIKSELINKKNPNKFEYRYSDLGFYILKRITENIIQQPIEEFLADNFYEPLGMHQTNFNPLLNGYDTSLIAPTEIDNYWRHRLIRGTVHDQGAALIGGVGGHAGLFTNANDLAKLMQLNLNQGFYGFDFYFSANTANTFNNRYFDGSRRGLGWDKPVTNGGDSPTGRLASQKTFGHTGFTGTCAWADPESQVIFIFLSNRTYPDANNTKLIRYNVRPKIHDLIYKAMANSDSSAISPNYDN